MYLQIAAATVILACGIIIGSGAALLHFKDDIVPNRLPPSGAIVRDMQARYDLTEEQTEKVDAVLAASRERMHTFFEGMREKMDAEFKELSSAMKDILTPEQFKRWERDFTSGRRRGPGRFGGRPGSGRPGPGGRPGGFGGGPGGGRSRSGRTDPNGKSGPGRRDHLGFRPGQRGPTEPNAQVE
jgi:hypothetical protein